MATAGDGPLAGLPDWALPTICSILWAASFWYSGFDQMYFMITVMAAIMGPGLGKRTSGMSAYSIFNQGQRHLLGELRAEQIDAEQRGDQYLQNYGREDGPGGVVALDENGNEVEEAEQIPELRSRDANQPCQCGSGKKAKRCCYARAPREAAGSCRKVASSEPDPLLDKWREYMEVVDSGHDRKGR
eukprot:TRINITY_DN10186_c2_g1_i1.p1 TRINITY_DN10186_c2_g1~~TRINITY_DN10186_c2_g1_i1.p1  ORF type:complete len:201 (+),score=33.72 TRINITY_DN10186_c2_g1_i1:44-604(+)